MNGEQGIAKEKVDPPEVVLSTPSLHKAQKKLQQNYYLKSSYRSQPACFEMGKQCKETCSRNLRALCAQDKELVWSYREEKDGRLRGKVL